MNSNIHSFETRLHQVDGPGMVLSASLREDEMAIAAGFVFAGVARSEQGTEVHVFQRPAVSIDSLVKGSADSETRVDVRIEPKTLESDILRLRAAIKENRGWNETMHMYTFCGSISRVLDELEALRGVAVKE